MFIVWKTDVNLEAEVPPEKGRVSVEHHWSARLMCVCESSLEWTFIL